jgi:hypothetical protein
LSKAERQENKGQNEGGEDSAFHGSTPADGDENPFFQKGMDFCYTMVRNDSISSNMTFLLTLFLSIKERILYAQVKTNQEQFCAAAPIR